ncbi:MAG: hypothetical protein K9K30_13050 [Burkholderiaceae bacterium]|nr:hypothetical protein [Burkholderiaceae bacterium]
MHSAKLRFDDTYVTSIEKHDLSTQAIFDFLDSKQPLVEASAQALGSSAFSALAAETKSAIQQIMATYIGPMAEIICADHFARSNDPRSLAQSLAGEISDKEQADSFFQAISIYLDGVAPAIAKPVKVPGSAAPGVFAPELRVAVLKIMTAYVGPMAEIVCADHFAQASDLRQLAQSLADEIPDPQQAAKFAAEIGKALNLSPA